MIKIEIDQTVYNYLAKKRIAFESPNDVLKRELKLNNTPRVNEGGKTGTIKMKKNPKVNLSILVQKGLLNEGERLIFKDYQGHSILNGIAILTRGMLKYIDDEYYSMSALARKLLQENGYSSGDVRGPLFWYTENGKSIKEIWDEFLESK